MAQVLDWRSVSDLGVFGRFAAEPLRNGLVIAFPTEVGYVAAASAFRDEAVSRLTEVSDRAIELAVNAEAVRDWLPSSSEVGRRLLKRFWPGPLTFACGDGFEEGVGSRLNAALLELVRPDDVLHLRSPAHDAIRSAMNFLPGPLLLAPIPAGQGEASDADEALGSAGDLCDLLIDAGSCRYRQPATTVELRGKDWRITRPGVLTEEMIRQQMATLIVFVCTGNTCRSPLAEALCKKVLAERLRCSVPELAERGYRVLSAGMAATVGMPAADEAVAVAQSLGADLSGHMSRSLTAELVRQADQVLVMTSAHLRALREQVGESSNARMLSPDCLDVDDPIGQSREAYEKCARQMQAYVERLVEEVVERG